MQRNTFLVQQLAVWQAIAQHSSSTAALQATEVQAAQGWPQPHAAQPQQFPPLQAGMQPQRSGPRADGGLRGPSSQGCQPVQAPSAEAAPLAWQQHIAPLRPRQPAMWRAASEESADTAAGAGQAPRQPRLAASAHFPAVAQQGSGSPAEFPADQTLLTPRWQQHIAEPQLSAEWQGGVFRSSEAAAAGGAQWLQAPQEWQMPADMAAIGGVQLAAQGWQTPGHSAAAGSVQQAPQVWQMRTAQPPISDMAAAAGAPAASQHWWQQAVEQQTAEQQHQLALWQDGMQWGDDGEV